MPYEKPWRSYAEQLQTLIDRGLLVTDRQAAYDYVERIGYYRLSGYWYPFRDRDDATAGQDLKSGTQEPAVKDAFRQGATFQNAVDLYVFDKKLRLLALDALERIEVALRVDVSHVLGKLDKFAYLNHDLLHHDFCKQIQGDTGLTAHHAWLSKHAQLINRSKEEFVRHNKTKYGQPLAIWVACEVWDFDALSRLFSGMRESEQDAIALKYRVANGRIFATWLRSLNYLRNVCAHHSRLWNRNIVDQPRLPPQKDVSWVGSFEKSTKARARCFLLFCITNHMLNVINPRSSWPDRLRDHLETFPDLSHVALHLGGMGTDPNWRRTWGAV